MFFIPNYFSFVLWFPSCSSVWCKSVNAREYLILSSAIYASNDAKLRYKAENMVKNEESGSCVQLLSVSSVES